MKGKQSYCSIVDYCDRTSVAKYCKNITILRLMIGELLSDDINIKLGLNVARYICHTNIEFLHQQASPLCEQHYKSSRHLEVV